MAPTIKQKPNVDAMEKEIRLTREIHYFVRGQLPFDEELKLLEEIIESDKWLGHLEIDLCLHVMSKQMR